MILALWHKVSRPTLLEIVCFVLSIVGIGFYFSFSDPIWSLATATAVNTLGGIPTLVRLSKDPKSEKPAVWTLVWLAGLFSLLSLERYGIELWLFPLCSFVLTSLILGLALRRAPEVLTA